jgi:hypothetical protein
MLFLTKTLGIKKIILSVNSINFANILGNFPQIFYIGKFGGEKKKKKNLAMF